MRERLVDLEQQAYEIADEVALKAEMRLVITRLEEFAVRVKDGLAEADWSLQRELIRTLVGRVEVGKEDVNIVFRIPPEAVSLSGEKKSLQLCRKSSHRSLGYAFSVRAGVTLDGLAQQLFDQAEHPRICDLLFDLSEQQAMIYRVEVGRYVHLHYVVISLSQIAIHLAQGILCTATWTVSLATIRETSLEDRFEHLHQRTLEHSVAYCWNAQRAFCLAAYLLDIDPANRLRRVALCFEGFHQIRDLRL